MRESLPKKFNLNWDDETKKPRIVNLQEQDLELPASFKANCIGHTIILVPAQERLDPGTKRHVRVPDTAVRLKVKGGILKIYNSHVLRMLMGSKVYERNYVWPDPEDPTGFWQEQGVIVAETRQVSVLAKMKLPSLDEIDFSKTKRRMVENEKGEMVPVEYKPLIVEGQK